MKTTSRRETAYMLMSLSGNAIFGFSFLFSKLAMNVAEPFVLLAVRFGVAFLLLNVLRFTGLVPCDFKGKKIQPVILLGIYQPVLYFICESYGIKYSSSSFAGIIIALIPIAGLVLGSFILKEKQSPLRVLFSILSVAGVLVMTMTGPVNGFQWKGFLLLLGAVFSAALFNIHSRNIADQFTAFERTYVMFAIGTIAFFLMAFLRIRGNWTMWVTPLTNGRFWISILYLSCVSSVGAFMLLNKALDVLEVARSMVFANITTVISVLAGVLILHEQFSMIQVVGIVMVIIGVYGVNRREGKKNG